MSAEIMRLPLPEPGDAHPLDWYPEPTDEPKGIPVEVVESWVDAYLDYEDSRPEATQLEVMVEPVRPSEAAVCRARGFWDQRVYFMRCLDCRLIKIGYSKDYRRRKAQLERSTEHVLDIIGTQLGDRWLEARIHRLFAADRVEGEWLRPSDGLLAYVRAETSPLRDMGEAAMRVEL